MDHMRISGNEPSSVILSQTIQEVIHNLIQQQLLTILKSVLNRSIGYVLFRKYTMHDDLELELM